jgi:hypothetical protein
MRTRITLAAAGLLLATLTACSGDARPDMGVDKPKAAPSVDADAIREAAGLPKEPKGDQRQAFLDGLNAIDQDIVHGKEDKAISRGIDTCGIFKRFPGDRAKHIEQTNKRWISANHPDGHGLDTAEKILDTAHKHICPDF